MAPSADIKKASTPAKDTEAAKLPSGNGVKEQGTTSDAGKISKAGSNTQAANGSQRKEQPVEGSKEGKLSGKESKDKAKAEKAARRAKEKEGRQGQPVADLEPKKQPEQKARRPSTTATGPPSSTPKGQHKRTGSNSISTQKLPLRPAQTQAPPMEEEPEKENKNVSWFDHLYGPPRRTSIAGAGKDVHPAILALGLQMRNYEICGSSCRCVATLLAFKRVIESYVTPPSNSLPRHLTTHLSSQIEYLVSCRPMSMSMGNSIRWLKVEISAVDVSTQESVAKADLCNAIDTYIQEKITVADQVIATKANDKIKDGDVILTYVKSNVVQQTLVEAHRQGKRFRVIVVDTRPLLEGKNLARALSDLGIEVKYSLFNGLSHVINEATKVFLGAHAMMSNGKLFSRVGTAMVAMKAKLNSVPVIVCCESVKFSDRADSDCFVHNEIAPDEELIIQGKTSSPLADWKDVPNLQILNLMYDLTPAEYITVVYTEYGPIPPSSVPVIQRLSTGT